MAAAEEMSSLRKGLLLLILHHLDEEKMKETVHRLEEESGLYFNMGYFEELVTKGAWDDVEKYLNGFTEFNDNKHSMKIFFKIRRQKYLEALDKNDHAKARDILVKDLKIFACFDQELFKDLALLPTLQNIREDDRLERYGDTKSARANLFMELKKIIRGNPKFCDKLQFPTLKNSSLWILMNQSFKWQHQLCKNPRPNPDMKTLYVDHTCNQHRSLRLPDSTFLAKIVRLTYTKSGRAVLALADNAVHKVWKWEKNRHNVTALATTKVPPQMWQPTSGIMMTNDICEVNLEDSVPCFALLSRRDLYLMSTSGGKVSLFNMTTFETIKTFMPPPPATTSLAFQRIDKIIVFGMKDSSIRICNLPAGKITHKLCGHLERITGLAFSADLKVLVSSGADAQLCVWDMNVWKKQASKFLQIPPGRARTHLAQTRVQFHRDQIHFLAVHETQIAIYEVVPNLDCVKQWSPQDSSVSITDATYSCDSQSIYVAADDGSVCIFTSTTLGLRYRISPTTYLPSNPSTRIFPLAITAHPSEADQFAVGLTDGGVHIIEPMDSEGGWDIKPLPENGPGSSAASTSGGGSNQQPRHSSVLKGLTDGGVHILEPMDSEGGCDIKPVLPENGPVSSAASTSGGGSNQQPR